MEAATLHEARATVTLTREDGAALAAGFPAACAGTLSSALYVAASTPGPAGRSAQPRWR